jgi:uncharacterized protein (UPF0210 family)
MKIRSVTVFDNPGEVIQDETLQRAERFCQEATSRFLAADYILQSNRYATPPFPLFLSDLSPERVLPYVKSFERSFSALGYDYLTLGPALPAFPGSYSLIPDMIQHTENIFCSGLMTELDKGVSLGAVRACGEIIYQLAAQSPDGFANLFFAALGNVDPGNPFFPAAYHQGETPIFSIAAEAADLAVTAFSEASTFQEARHLLISAIETHGKRLSQASRELEELTQFEFGGIDFSLAPYPTADLSIGTALEKLGVKPLGSHGSVTAAAFLADTIDRADFPRTGFCGLMLPLLEDAVLSLRAAEGALDIKDLLLFSTVCGTGLDTLPLPGDISSEQISAILFDLAGLSLRLNKPLTARLMPIPKKKTGESTDFDFPYFANSTILDLQADSLSGFFSQDGFLDLKP